MSEQKKIAAIHDLSGFGRCSLTVIIPVLSAMGIQVCPVPTAVLATHTGGFGKVIMRDLTDFIPDCLERYKALGISFDAVYSGFLASESQIDHCLDFFGNYKNALKIVDPVMGDHGRIYSTYTEELCRRMGELAGAADVITPNLTEAAILLGEEYAPVVSVDKAREWLSRLREFADTVVLTGVTLSDEPDGILVNISAGKDGFWRAECDYVPEHYPGTGDLFTAVLTGGLLKKDSLSVAVSRATAFTQTAVKTTFECRTTPRNGVAFEEILHLLVSDSIFSAHGKF
ncbi:MAG: pyridoxamine kinase [Oscillospiraceae bacterium]|nr:pyridoxamine kinase [Oscillospiraceae bacterium]